MELIEVAQSHDYLWNGAVCAPNGRLFASMPGWTGPTPGVVEIAKDGSWKPYPNNHWNQWQNGLSVTTQPLLDFNRVFEADRGSLWVLDAAAPNFAKAIPGAVKLIEIDLSTSEVVRVIRFAPEVAHPGTRLAHIRFAGHYAIMAESKEGSFYIIDLRDNSYRRVLVGHPLMRCLPDDVPTMEGRLIRLLDGRPMYIHNDLLEFGEDESKLFFMCLFGSRIFEVDVNVLTNPALTDDEIAEKVTVAHVVGPWVAGLCRDKHGNIYMSDAEKNGMTVLRPNGEFQQLVTDDQIVWPIAPSVGPDGYLYFPSTQLNRIPMFSGGPNLVQKPWKIFKIKVS